MSLGSIAFIQHVNHRFVSAKCKSQKIRSHRESMRGSLATSFVVALSSLLMVATTFSTPALAQAKDKIDQISTEPLTSAVSAAGNVVGSFASNAFQSISNALHDVAANIVEDAQTSASISEQSAEGSATVPSNLEGVVWSDGFATCTLEAGASVNGEELRQEIDTHKNTLTKFVAETNTTLTNTATRLFAECSKLSEVRLSGSFKFQGIPEMNELFQGCTSLTSLELPDSLDTSEVWTVSSMFDGCTSLRSLSLPNNFDTSAAEWMESIFRNCPSLESLTLPSSFYATNDYSSTNDIFAFEDPSTQAFALHSLTIPKVFQMNTDTGLPGLASQGAVKHYWTTSIDSCVNFGTTEEEAVANINNVLAGSSDSVTFQNVNIALSFNANGGTFATTNTSQSLSQNADEVKGLFGNTDDAITGSDIPLPTRTGYSFLGYSTEPNGEAVPNPTKFPNSDATYYAVWGEPEDPYVVKSSDGTTLTFTYGAQPAGTEGTDWWKVVDNPDTLHPWTNNNTVTKVVIDQSFASHTPTDTSFWFYELRAVTSITGLNYINTTSVKNMQSMFAGCLKLSSLTIPQTFNTSSVEDMSGMFSRCSSLTSLNLPESFNTSKVKEMDSMFVSCMGLTELELPDVFDTSLVNRMDYMFSSCSSLTSLTLPDKFTTRANTNLEHMFEGCSSLTSLDLSHFTTDGSFVNMGMMFDWCDDLASLTLSKTFTMATGTKLPGLSNSTSPFWITSMTNAVTYGTNESTSVNNINTILGGLQDGATQTFTKATVRLTYDANDGNFGQDDQHQDITEAYLYGNENDIISKTGDGAFDYTPIPSRTGYNYFGYNISSTATTADTPTKFPGASTTYYAVWGYSPYVVKSSDGTTLTFMCGAQPTVTEGTDWWEIEDSYSVAPGWKSDTVTKVTIDESFKSYKPTSTAYWFYQLDKMSSIEGLSNLDTSASSNMSHMFSGCGALPVLELPAAFDTRAVEDMSCMFEACSSLASLTLSSTFDTGKVTTMLSMFQYCSELTSLTFPDAFKPTAATNMESMFNMCGKLTSLDLSHFTTSSSTNIYNMFGGCSLLESLTLPKTFTMQTNTWLPGLSSSTNSFWIASMSNAVSYNTSEDTAVDNINTVLEGLQDGASQTFTKATVRLAYDANGGNFGQDDQHQDITEAYLYGNENDVISKTGEGAFDNTPIPSRTGYNYMGYSTEQTATTADTPTKFPASSTTYYAIWSQGAYVVKSDAGKTLTFTYGAQPEGTENEDWWTIAASYITSVPRWKSPTVTKVVIDQSFKTYEPTYTSYWFYGLSGMTSITGLANLNTASVVRMYEMFGGCSSLTSLEFPDGFDTSKVTDDRYGMAAMFANCSELTSLDLSPFTTIEDTNMVDMFSGCDKLESLTLSKTFTMKERTKLPGLSNSVNPFWISSMSNAVSYNTSEDTAVDNINTVLEGLQDGASQTFTKATVRLAYDANGGKFGTATPAVTEAYLYGNENDVISKTGDGAFDNTPVPARENYNYLGYNISSTATTPNTPTKFPASSTTYYAIWSQGAYVVKSSDGTTLTFMCGAQPADTEGTDWWEIEASYDAAPGWSSTSITKVVIDQSFAGYKPTSTAYWFYGLEGMQDIEGLSNLDTSEVATMDYMFAFCNKLVSLELPVSFEVSKVTRMSDMFLTCLKLETLTFPNTFTPTNLTSMTEMFMNCQSLSSLTLPSGFTTTASTSMSRTFSGCSKLKSLTLPKSFTMKTGTALPGLSGSTSSFWITSMTNAVTYGTDQASSVNNINTVLGNLEDGASQTFTLASVRLTYDANNGNFGQDDQHQDITEAYLYGNENDVISKTGDGAFDNTPIPSRTGYNYMGYSTEQTATTADTPTKFPASSTTYYAIWSQGAYVVKSDGGATLTFLCGAQPEGDKDVDWWVLEESYSPENLPGWYGDTSFTKVVFNQSFSGYKPTSTAYWFYGLENLTDIEGLSNLDTSGVENMRQMFSGCGALPALELPASFDTGAVEDMTDMFSGCSGLTSLTLPNSFNTNKAKYMAGMFMDCTSLESLTLPNTFTTSAAEEMASMFAGCSELTALTLPSGFVTSIAANMSWIFYECNKLESLTLPKGFTMQEGTQLPDLDGATESFWIASMTNPVSYNTSETNAVINFNTVLGALQEGSTQTFTKATERLSYSANGGSFGKDSDDRDIVTAYLYGNEGDVIIKTGDGAFDNTPVPTRANYNYAGYATTSTGTVDAKPSVFPATVPNNPYYAIWTQATYMSYDAATKTLTMTFGQAPTTGTEVVNWWEVDDSYSAASVPGWTAPGAASLAATSVVIDSSVATDAYQPTSTAWWFSNLASLTSVSGLNNVKTANIASVAHMFDGCAALSDPVLPASFKDAPITDLSGLFRGCAKQTTSGLPTGFTVGATANLTSLYEGCTTLKKLNLSGFTTTSGTAMADMFQGDTALEEVTLPKTFQFATGSEFPFTDTAATSNFWIANSATKLGDAASWNSFLTNLADDASPHTFVRANITLTFEAQDGKYGTATPDQKQAFLYGNANAEITEAELPVPSRAGYGFAGYAATATGDVIEITAFPATNTSYYAIYTRAAWMLYNGAGELTLSYGPEPTPETGETVWQVADDYSASKKPEWTAYSATKVTIDDSVKNGYKPLSMAYWFSNMYASTATIANLANLDTSAVTTMEGTFAGYAKNATGAVVAPDLSKFNTQNVSNMASMFAGCSAFETINISAFNTQNVENFSEMFAGDARLTTLDTSKLTSPKAQTMASMFEGDAVLGALNLAQLTAPATLTTTASMFSGCTALTTLNLAGLALGGAVTTTDMFKTCTGLTEITLAKNFVFGTSTGFAFAGTASSNFWIADINTKMGATAALWNTYLAALTANATSHTFTLATRTYTLDANGGLFGTGDAATETLSYYGNEGGSLGTIAAPARTGWTQDGWWTAATGGTQVTIPATFGAAATTTVYAHWNRDSNYAEVSFNTNGAAETIDPVYVLKGSAVTAPTQTLTRENATFVFWAKDTGLKDEYDFAQAVTEDITLYALWAATTDDYISVIFDANGGSFVTEQIIAVGTAPSRPQNPTRADGAIFKRWNTNTALTNEYLFTALSQDTTLYASYTAKDQNYCMVTFDSNGGTAVDQQQVQKGSVATKPEDPRLANATFEGWYKDEDLFHVFDWTVPITEDITLFADWQATAGYFTVEFVENGGTPVDTQIVAQGGYATEPISTREHATLVGWSEDPTFVSNSFSFAVPITKDTMLYANWKADAGYHSVTFNTAGSQDFIETQIVADGAYATKPAVDPVRENAVFDVWCSDTALEVAFGFTTTPITQDTTLYARYKAQNPTSYAVVTFNPNGGSFVGQALVAKGSTVTKPQDPTLAGATFTGWYKDTALEDAFNFASAITQDMTLYARWQGSAADNTVVVIFNPNGGSFVQSQIITRGQSATRPADPTRTGATFDTWCADTSLAVPYVFSSAVNEDTTVYARWSANAGYHSVNFNTAGSQDFIETQIVADGAYATKPATDPVRENAVFDAWCSDTALEVAFGFTTTPITQDTTLYARYKAQNPTSYAVVTFNPNGGSFVGQALVAKGSTVTKPQDPTLAGATFTGWYKDTALEDAFNFASAVTEDMTLYARWQGSAADNTVVVIFNPNGGSFVQSQIITRGHSATRPADPTRTGATFDTWCADTSLAVPYVFSSAVNEDTTVYARWSANAGYHSVNFNTAGSQDFIETQIVADGAYATKPATDPVRENAVFDTWCQDTALEVAFGFTTTPITQDTTLYARYKAQNPTSYAVVTFNPNGGSFVGQALVAKGSPVTEPQAPTRASATFRFWSEDRGLQTPYNFATAVTDDMTLYARWAGTDAANTVAVIFNPNGGSFVQTQIVTRGESATRPANPTRDGALFDTWCEDTGLTAPYAFGPVQEETTVYARWSAADPATTAIVTFNPNGGSFVESQVVAKGATATRPANPTLANATFDTWCEDTALEDAFDFASPITDNTTLYARWSATDPANYSVVNFNTQGGSFVNSQVVANGSRATRPATIPSKEHYTFDNWYQDAEALNLWDFNSPIHAATTIYAAWTPVAYEITFVANGLTFTDGTTTKTEAVDYGVDLTAPELSLPADVEFVGWFTEPTGGAPMPEKCAGAATYFAHYNILPPGPTPGPEPTPDAGGDLVPITGDTLSALSWMFVAVIAGGIALATAYILRRKRSE